MDTIQLINYLKKDKYARKYFCGVLPINKLPRRKILRPCCFIINTHKSNLPGEHWFAIFVPKFGKIEYFDSYGLKPINEEVHDFIKLNGGKYIYNEKNIQGINSENCGKFSLFYLYMRTRGFNLNKIQKFFVKNKNFNDLIVNKLFYKLKYK